MPEWCRKHNLLLNVKKTKEIVFDFRKRQNVIDQIYIGNDGVEKYLGNVICGDLKWTDNIKEQVKKSNKRLYFLRKLKEFSVDTKILNLFYTCVIQSVAVFGLIIWYNSASVMDKQQVDKIRKVAQKIIGSPVTTLNDIYDTKIMCKVKSVINDTIVGRPTSSIVPKNIKIGISCYKLVSISI